MQTREIPLSIKHLHNFYSDFLSRLGAALLDGLFMAPISVMVLLMTGQSIGVQYLLHAFYFLFGCFYMIYLPKRFGGTPGKLIAGLKIVQMDGSDLDWLAAFNRYSVSMALGFFTTAGTVYGLSQVDAEILESMNWIERSTYLQSFTETYNTVILWIIGTWTLADIIVFFTNDRRRALHDMIGGTVVIKKLYDNKIKQYMAGESDNDIETGAEPTPTEIIA